MIRRSVRRAAGGALFFFLAGQAIASEGARADDAPTKVTVIRPTGGDVVLIEIATRAWAELSAGGVAAVLLDCPTDGHACQTEAPPPGGQAITLRTFRQFDETITEAALTPAGHDRPTVRRLLTVSDQAVPDPKVMAIRAVELVNAMLLQVDSAAAENAAALRRAAIADAEFPGHHVKIELPVVAPRRDDDLLWTLGAGGSFLKGRGGLSAAFGFAIVANRLIYHRFGLLAILTEAPSRTGTATIDGNLSTNQQLVAIEVTYRFYQSARLTSRLALGDGAYHVNASWSGPSQAMHPASPDTVLALLLSGGGGLVLALGREMSVYLEARAELALPNPVAYTVDGHALKTADPSLLVSLGLQRAF